jgi:regulator of protease activity HflC (stomatin/prohibitin superfamily)
MAEITNLLVARHVRADASTHILHYRGGRLRRSGRGLAFWFLPMSASLAELPADDRELSILFHGRSSDFQDVTAQGVVTYRIATPATLAERIDFSIDLVKGTHRRQPLEKIALLLSELAHQHASGYIGTTPIRAILTEGYTRIRERVEAGLGTDPGLAEMGIAIASVRISSVKPTPDLEKALEAPARERIQQDSDEAAFTRRALAVEKERAIQENALVNQIELARREEQLIAQRGQNARRQAGEQAEAERIASEAAAARSRIEAESEAHGTLVNGEATAKSVALVEGAKVDVERARMEVMRDVPTQVLMGLAARELAGKLRRIEHLNLSPDALGPALQSLVEAGTRRLEAEEGA